MLSFMLFLMGLLVVYRYINVYLIVVSHNQTTKRKYYLITLSGNVLHYIRGQPFLGILENYFGAAIQFFSDLISISFNLGRGPSLLQK